MKFPTQRLIGATRFGALIVVAAGGIAKADDTVTYDPVNDGPLGAWLQHQADGTAPVANPLDGKRTINIPAGTHYIEKHVIITTPSITIAGFPHLVQGSRRADDRDDPSVVSTVLKLHPTSWNPNSSAAVIAASGTSGFHLMDIEIRGYPDAIYGATSGDAKAVGKKGQYGVVLYGSSDCMLENVRFGDLGKTLFTPSASHVVVIASEASVPTSKRSDPEVRLAQYAPAAASECRNNTIKFCRFIDSTTAAADAASAIAAMDIAYNSSNPQWPMVEAGQGPRAQFGIRAITNWNLTAPNSSAALPHTSYANKVVDTKIEDCYFRGFLWNAVEIGGPATVKNKIRRNVFALGFQTPVEADKGARDNDFNFNEIWFTRSNKDVVDLDREVDVNKNGILETSEDTNGNGRRDLVATNDTAFAIRDQGRGVPARYAVGNKYYKNKITTILGRGRNKTAAFYLNQSDGCILRQNKVTHAPGLPSSLVRILGRPWPTGPSSGPDGKQRAIIYKNSVLNANFTQGSPATHNTIPLHAEIVPFLKSNHYDSNGELDPSKFDSSVVENDRATLKSDGFEHP